MATVKNNKPRRRYAAPVGGIFIVLALIGVVTVVVVCIRLTMNFLDNKTEKERLENMIRPVVMFDPGPIDDPKNLRMEQLLRFCMWSTLKSSKRASYMTENANECIVPASDLDVACAQMFGPDIQLVHQSFGDYESSYIYEENDGTYVVPITVNLLVYEPEVVDISKDGEYFNLTVAYIPPTTAWTDMGALSPDNKQMIYVLKRNGDGYQIVKVQDPPNQGATEATAPPAEEAETQTE